MNQPIEHPADLEQALDLALSRVARYARLVGSIHYQQSSNHVTDAAMRAETGRLLDVFFDSGSGVVRTADPADGSVAAAVPARPVVVSSPLGTDDRPGTDLTPHGRGCIDTCCLPDTWAMGTADYASAKRVMWA